MIPRIQTALRCLVPSLLILSIVLPARSDLGIAYAAAEVPQPSTIDTPTQADVQTSLQAELHASVEQETVPVIDNVSPDTEVVDAEVMAAKVLDTQALFASTAATELVAGQHTAQLGTLPLTIERAVTTADQSLAVQFQGIEPISGTQLSPTGIAFQLDVRNLAEVGTASAPSLDVHVPVTLTLDYGQLTFPFGGDFTERLAIYRLSGCANRLVPSENGNSVDAYTCKNSEQLPSSNDVTSQQLRVAFTPQVQSPATEITATQQISNPASSLAQADAEKLFLPSVSESTLDEVYYVVASATGDYSSTPHSVVNDFQTDTFTGNFATSYPIPVPPSVAGPVPGLSLNYNTGNVWGSDDNTGGQAGQQGLGWELEPGTITVYTTKYWLSSNWYMLAPSPVHYFISLNGVRSKLVNVSGNLYHLESDPNWKVELLTSSEAGHPDTTSKNYWLVTTPDGTKYRFGGEFVPTTEDATSNRDQNSAAYMPLGGPTPSSKVYEWHLDRVEDVHGNVINYYYAQEDNWYTRPGTSTRLRYIRATHLRYIEYTKRAGQVTQPHARILFNMELRCTDNSSVNCTSTAQLPDAPIDLLCHPLADHGACPYTLPSFWSDLRLDSIQTQVYDPAISKWRTSALYDLKYTFPTPPGSGSPKKLWLSGIEQRAGGNYNRLAFSQLETESADVVSQLTFGESGNEPGLYKYVGSTATTGYPNGYLLFRNVDFGSGTTQALIRHGYYTATGTGTILELRLGSPTGTLIGQVVAGAAGNWRTGLISITSTTGVHDLYIIFKKKSVNVNWLRFLPTNPLPAGLPAAEYSSTMLQGPVSTAHYFPVISRVRTELGGTVDVVYGQTHPCSANFTVVRPPYDCFYEPWNSQHRTWKVTSLTKSDPLNVSASETYTYTYSTPTWGYHRYDNMGHIYLSCWPGTTTCPLRRWNDFRGHAIVTETNAQGQKTEYRYYQGMNGDKLDATSGTGTYSANITLSDSTTRVDYNWLKGKLAETSQFDANNNVLIRTVYWYTDTVTAGTGDIAARIVSLQAQEQTVYGPTPKTTRIEYDYDSYGNMLRERQLGDTSTSSDDRTVERSYVYNTSAHILNTPQWEKLWAGSAPGSAGQEQSYTAYAYDNQSIGTAPIKGNLTLVRNYWQTTPSAGYADTVTSYDTRGRVVSVTDANNHSTSTEYQSFYGYPMTVTNELDFVTVSEVDPGRGAVTKVTDANGKVTEVEYDSYGRLIKAWLPTEPRSGPASLEYEYAPQARPAYIKTRQLTDASAPPYLESWEFADGFGRTIQTQSPSINSGQRVVTSQQYNNLGQLYQSSSAYEGSGVAGSNYVTPTWSSLDGVTRLTYDALGRQTQSELLNAGSVIQSTQATYQVWTQQSYDANGHRRDYEYDGFGQLTHVREYNIVSGNPITYTTQYAYNLQGNLTQVTDHASNVTTISYDLLGRKTGMDDPDMGTWQYQYDAVGNLTAQQDGRGLWLHLAYDELDRLTAKRRDSTSGPLVSEYSYDVTDLDQLYSTKAYASNGISVTVETQVPERDDRYRATQNRWIVAGQGTFRMATSYDAADRVTQLQYPGDNADGLGEIVERSYNSVGQLDQVMSLMDGTPFIDTTTYLANGQIASQRFDQSSYGLLREYTYEAGTRRLLTQKASSAILPGSYNLQELTYTYDDVGNITRILDDANSGQQQCFGYDQLDQLTRAFTGDGSCTSYSATGVGVYDHTYEYDTIGNITHFAGENYAYTGAQPHAVTAAFSNTYGYDDIGNQTTRVISSTAYTLTYDYENRLTGVYEGIAIVGEFVYDVDGQRVVGTVDGETVVYIAGVYEYHEGGATISYYDGSADSVAMRRVGHADDNGIFYIVGDHLGSASVIVHQDGTPSSYQYYYPFGGNRGGLLSPLTTKRYTGQYHEGDLPGGDGLSYYGARWYDAQVGKFTSADLLVPAPQNPLDFNRFAYVRNNPLRFIDPTGHVLADANSAVMLMEAEPVGNGVSTSSLSTDQSKYIETGSLSYTYHPVVGPQWGPDVVDYIYGGEMKNNPSSPIGNLIGLMNYGSARLMEAANSNGGNQVAKTLFAVGSAILKGGALAAWAYMVGPGQQWDHKPYINSNFGSWQQAGTQMYASDTWSNVQYGWTGRKVGFSAAELAWGAGIAQFGHEVYKFVTKDPSKSYVSYFTNLSQGRLHRLEDPRDQAAIALGIHLWDSYGPRLTRKQFIKETNRWRGLNAK